MKMCESHWAELRKAIDDRGLGHLVQVSAEAAAESIVDQVNGMSDEGDYDPLMNANFMIFGRAMQCGGLYLLMDEYCPLCELEKHTEAKASSWIEPCCDSILQHCRTLGLLQTPDQ